MVMCMWLVLSWLKYYMKTYEDRSCEGTSHGFLIKSNHNMILTPSYSSGDLKLGRYRYSSSNNHFYGQNCESWMNELSFWLGGPINVLTCDLALGWLAKPPIQACVYI